MRILVINPATRFERIGADEQDRLATVRGLAAGHEVRVLTRTPDYMLRDEGERAYQALGVPAQVLPALAARWTIGRLRALGYLDGAAWDYGAPDFLAALAEILAEWRPDLVWCHTSQLWGPAGLARRHGVPAVIRSTNFEARHFISEHGWSSSNVVRYLGKIQGERRATQAAVLAAITPADQAAYQQLNPRARVQLLPLRTLPDVLLPPVPRPPEGSKRRVFFMGSSYNVLHNAHALDFILAQVIPAVRQSAPDAFEFHILGGKVPERYLTDYAAPDVIFPGFVPDLDAYLATMDIALAPSLSGGGMQQKLFEPLCRGFATVTHARALAGYAFVDGEHVLLADTAEDFARQLVRLRDDDFRQRLGLNAHHQSASLFGPAAFAAYTQALLDAALS